MSLKDFKIKQSDIDTKGVVGAPDVLSGTATENKMIFDRLIRDAVRNYYNDLVDALEQYGVESIAQNAGKVKKLRLNDDGYLEVSEDGVTFKVAGSGGHKIVGQDNKPLPDRTTMWFQNAEVTDSGSSTVVRTKPDWTDVKNKPLVGEKTAFFEWSEGYVPEDWVGPNEWRGFYKVSSTPLSREELVGCVVEYTTADGIKGEVTITEEMIDEVKNGEVLVAYINDYVDIYLGIPICSVETTFELGTLEMVLDRGLWVAYDDPGVGDTITKISKVSGETWDKALMPKIEKGDLPPIAWEDLENRPFGETVYEDDCELLPKPEIAFTAPTIVGNYEFCKLSSRALRYEQLMKTVFKASLQNATAEATIDTGSVYQQTDEFVHFYLGPFFLGDVETGDYAYIAAYKAGDLTVPGGGVITVPEEGLYIGKPIGSSFPFNMEFALNGPNKYYYLHIGYVCDEGVKKIDEKFLPERDTDEVKFTKDLITTYEIGSISLENGQAVIPAEGKTLQEVWDTIFVTELPPTVEEPKVTLGAQKFKAYEVGEKVETTYNVELSAGKYSYGPDTGITASAWSVKDTLGVELTSSVGAFSTLVVRDNTSYSITATATHGAGAIPFTNLGNEYPEGQIAAGEKSATSAAITGYRNGFYGTAADKEAAIDSSFVRGLANKSGKTPAAGNVWNLAIPVGAMRIVFAYPATIRDVSSVLDVNGLNAEIKSAFTKYTVSVEGANGYEGIDYKVCVLDRAAATTEANTFKITI